MRGSSQRARDADPGGAVTPEQAPLPALQVGGFGASVDAFAWEPDSEPAARRMRLWFLSLLGPQQALKAIWARLLRGEVATLSRETLGQARFCALALEGPGAWRSFSARLPGAGGHQLVLLPEVARHAAACDDFLLLPRAAGEAATLHARFLDRRVDLPLHVGWTDWLWARALATGEAMALESEGILAYRCAPQPDALATDLSTAVADGTLRVPEEKPAGETGGAAR